MKNNMSMKWIISIALFVLPLLGISQVPATQSNGSIQFIYGGIGSDESAAIKAVAKNWPIYMEFSQRDGDKSAWVSEVSLVIKDANGRQIFNQPIDGPLILMKLNPGKYSAQATYQNKMIENQFYIDKDKHQRLSFQWR
jgi:hypothetical protein